MKVQLELLRAPMGVTLQDSGRGGYLRYGVAESGPMDWARHQFANRMLGRRPGAVAIEFGPSGLDLELDRGELQLSFCAPGFRMQLDGRVSSGPRRFVLTAGQTLEIRPVPGAMWGYLGLGAMLEVPMVLGSHAENTASGLHAMRLHAGQSIALRAEAIRTPAAQAFVDPLLARQHGALGILPGSQCELFSSEQQAALVTNAVSIAPRFDRMAYQLQGVKLTCEAGHDILSDAITMGAVQVPGDGRPFVLMADHQPTGGYPKIACICMADLPRLAQMSPGRPFYLNWIDIEQALERWQRLRRMIDNPVALEGVV